MYSPAAFTVDDAEAGRLLDALLGEVAATLVTQGPEGLCSTVIPMTWTPGGGEATVPTSPSALGTLRGHVAKANPVAREGHAGDALVVVLGPQAYISPSWYRSKVEHGRVVPTWDYVAVEAAGPLTLHRDLPWLRARVTELTDRFEGLQAAPWAVTDAPEDHVEAQLRAIVGVEVSVTRLMAKAKLSQNRPDADIGGVVAGLRAQDPSTAAGLAALVEQARPGRQGA